MSIRVHSWFVFFQRLTVFPPNDRPETPWGSGAVLHLFPKPSTRPLFTLTHHSSLSTLHSQERRFSRGRSSSSGCGSSSTPISPGVRRFRLGRSGVSPGEGLLALSMAMSLALIRSNSVVLITYWSRSGRIFSMLACVFLMRLWVGGWVEKAVASLPRFFFFWACSFSKKETNPLGS